MHDQPSVSELVQSVKNFVDNSAMPELTGRAAFHARVASNVLATILRDLENRDRNDTEELSRLRKLLNADSAATHTELNAQLRDKIRTGDMSIESDVLMRHLKMTAIAQLKVDQPKYSGLADALKE